MSGPSEKRRWLIRKQSGANRVHDTETGSIVGPDTEAVAVVALRDVVEAEQPFAKRETWLLWIERTFGEANR